jgi:response regulator RpfG family c-di-GMP phosphodiesterase
MLVDDEDMVITSIRAYLNLETEWEVLGFTSPEEAAKHLEKSRVDVVVSDYLMPRMTGLQLLGRAKEVQPEAARILLTGHADKQSAIHAINDVGLYQYLEKPWDNTQLRLVINSAIERTNLFRRLNELMTRLAAKDEEFREIQRRMIEVFVR